MPRDPGDVLRNLSGRAPVALAEGYHRAPEGPDAVIGGRDRRSGEARPEAPSRAGSPAPSRDATMRRDAAPAPHRRRPPRGPPRRPRRAGGRAARAPVRRLPGDGRPRPRREGRRRPGRRRPLRLEHAATALRRARRRPSSGASPTRRSGPSSSPAPTTSTTGRRSTGPTTSPALAGLPADTDRLVVLTPDRPDVVLGPLDLAVHGRVFATKRAPRSPLAGFDVAADERATWHVGMIHGSLSIPEQDGARRGRLHERRGRGLASRLPRPRPLALHPAGPRRGDPLGLQRRPRAGRPRPGPGGERPPRHARSSATAGARSTVEERRVGRTRFERVEVDAAEVGSQPALVERLAALADPDLVLDVRLIGVRPDDLDLVPDEVERELGERFFRVRVRDASAGRPARRPAAAARHDRRCARPRPRRRRSPRPRPQAATSEARETREALRLARLLLDGREVTL